MIFKLM